MLPDPERLTFGLSALGGGVVWGLYHLTTALLAGQPVHRQDVILALANVAIGVAGGALCAYFLGPALAELIPVTSLRDAHALGFAIGGGAWEVAPFVYRALRRYAARKTQEAGK